MRDSLVFYLNGNRTELSGADATMTLADWLRQRRQLVGTKIVCNEGDCGACSVLVGRRDGNSFDYRPIDSCIAFPYQLDKTHVITVEGLATDGCLSPVQQAMVDCHGSQCGFCTPGFVATMHGMIEKEESLSDDVLRYGLSGNLCRCTGYVQILDAGKSIDTTKVAALNDRFPPAPMVDDFESLGNAAVEFIVGDHKVFVPQTIEHAVELLQQSPDATIVSGATDFGVVHNHGRAKVSDIVSLCSLQDFNRIEVIEDETRGDELHIGGGATWTDIEAFVEHWLPQYHDILTRFGSPQIRNAGTLGGNLAGGSPIGDSIPFHMVCDSTLELTGIAGARSVKLCDFYTGYRENLLEVGELITSVVTPLPKSNERVVLHKISKRRDMDISTETLALWVKLDGDMIAEARIAIGGVGPMVMRMKAAEDYLAGQPLIESALRAAGKIISESISPWSDVRGGDDYRLQLAENLMAKSFHELCQPEIV